MIQRKLPKSLRKYIRREKARIRRDAANDAEAREHLAALSARYRGMLQQQEKE